MSTLRPPKPDQIQRTEDVNVPDQPSSQTTATSYTPLFLVAASVLFVIAVLLLIVRREPNVQAVSPTAAPISAVTVRETVVVTPVPTLTPDCVSAQSQLTMIESLEKKGDWPGASRQAEAALGIDRLCPNDVAPLTHHAVLAGLNVLHTKVFEPLDVASHQEEVEDFLRLRERARLAHVDFPTPLQVAQAAYSISQFRLTVAAIEIALAEGTFNPTLDRAMTKLYISALYGLGFWYTQAASTDPLYAEGLAYLSASHRLAIIHKTGQGEAAALLTKLLGNEETAWPAPYRSPLLAST